MKSSSIASSDASSDASHGKATAPDERRRSARFLLVFLAGLLVALGVAESLLRLYVVPIEDGRANRVHLVYTDPRVDAVLGDSHLYRAFINSETFVNLARAGSSPAALEIVAREYFRHRRPGRVIVEASPQLFNRLAERRGAQRHDRFFGQNRWFPFALYVFEPGIAGELAEIWDLGALREKAAIARGRKRAGGPIVRKEAAHRRALSADERERETRQRVASNRPVADVEASEGFAAYRRTIEGLLRGGAEVCMARTPVTPLFLAESRDDPHYRETEAALVALARQLGVPYVDFLDLDLDLEVTSFTNPDHLTTAAGMAYADRLEAACFPRP